MKILCPKCRTPTDHDVLRCPKCGYDMVLNNPGPRYRITRVIKAGGQGAVYETIGEDGKVYAVKEMLDSFADPDERQQAVQRFEDEGHLLMRLQHPRIPRVYAVFNDEGRHYLAMEFVRGEDLEDIVQRRGAIPEAEVLPWAAQICDVLIYLHKTGLIYRDMKPSNVMLDRQDGQIKVVDFGIARLLQRSGRMTQIGTPGYAPPEQYQGLASPQSDIYALAATLHHLLTGRDPGDQPPFSFPPARDLRPSLSQRTSDALQRALQVKPEDRFPSMEAFRDALIGQPSVTQALPPTMQVPKTQPTQPTQKQPQVAPVPVPQPQTPPTQAPQAVPVPQPQTPPPAQAARPASVPQPQAQTLPGAQPTQAAQARRSGGGMAVLFILLLLLGVAGVLLWQNSSGQMIPGLGGGATTTVATVSQEVTVTLTVAVPEGNDVNGALASAFITKMQEQFGDRFVEAKDLRSTQPADQGTFTSAGTLYHRYQATITGVVYLTS